MNPQVKAAIRSLLIGLGGLVVGLGWIDNATMVSLLGDNGPVLGAVIWLVGFIWSQLGHSQTATIVAARSIPDVRAVITTPEIANSEKFKDDDKVITATQALMNKMPPATVIK